MRGDLVLIVSHLPHIRHLCVVGLTEESGESGGLEQRVLTAMQRGHSEAERFVTDRRTELAERLRQELERARKRQDPVRAWLSARVAGLPILAGRVGRALTIPSAPATGAASPGTVFTWSLIRSRGRRRDGRSMQRRNLVLAIVHLLDEQHALLAGLDDELAETVEPGGALIEIRVDLLHHLLQPTAAKFVVKAHPEAVPIDKKMDNGRYEVAPLHGATIPGSAPPQPDKPHVKTAPDEAAPVAGAEIS